jgi:hypothetical protein
MKYYNFRITNLGMRWFRLRPIYTKKKSKFDRGRFFMFNWRLEWWYTDKPFKAFKTVL